MSEIVNEVIDGRTSVYGDPVDGMKRTAQIWSGILDFEVRPDQVPLMLMGYKLMRASERPDYSDNSDDVEGYLDIFRKVVGEDMVHARSVSEYLEIKGRRDEAEEASEEMAVYVPSEHLVPCQDRASGAGDVPSVIDCTCFFGKAMEFLIVERVPTSTQRALHSVRTVGDLPPYDRGVHTTECIARISVEAARAVQCTCEGHLSAGRWFYLAAVPA